VARRSKMWVCGRWLVGIAGSNPAAGMYVRLFWVLCVVRQRSLWRADHSSRGVLPTLRRRCLWSRNLKNEERVGQQRHKKQKLYKHFKFRALRAVLCRGTPVEDHDFKRWYIASYDRRPPPWKSTCSENWLFYQVFWRTVWLTHSVQYGHFVTFRQD